MQANYNETISMACNSLLLSTYSREQLSRTAKHLIAGCSVLVARRFLFDMETVPRQNPFAVCFDYEMNRMMMGTFIGALIYGLRHKVAVIRIDIV